MAWELFERDGVSGFFGDRPSDEFAAALEMIARTYEERFGRNPTVAEVLYGLERVLCSVPERYVSDPDGLRAARISIDRKESRTMSALDPARFEGVYAEEPPEYQVVRRDANREATNEVVLSVPTLDVRDRVLIVEYRRLGPDLDERGAEQLIVTTLLREFLVDSYRVDADTIELHDLATGAKRTIPYPA